MLPFTRPQLWASEFFIKNMDTEQTKIYLRVLLDECSIPKRIIKKVLLFGSVANNRSTSSSDCDILIIYSASSMREYKILAEFVSNLIKVADSTSPSLDVFLCHVKTFDFINSHLYIQLHATLENSIIIYQGTKNIIPRYTKKKVDKKIILANIFLLLEEIHKINPTIFHEERRKNLKTLLYAFRHLSYLSPKYLPIKNLAEKRLSHISMESPLDTIETDFHYLKLLFKSAGEINASKVDLGELFHVELASFYFIEIKRSISSKKNTPEQMNKLIASGLSIIFKILMQEKIIPGDTLQKNLQYLTDLCLNQAIEKRDYWREYGILMKSCDNLIKEISS
jgi:predicted nucleotidyltransferase